MAHHVHTNISMSGKPNDITDCIDRISRIKVEEFSEYCVSMFELKETYRSEDGGEVVLRCWTKMIPPVYNIIDISREFPEISFVLLHYCLMIGFQGFTRIQAGEFLINKKRKFGAPDNYEIWYNDEERCTPGLRHLFPAREDKKLERG